MQASKLKLSWKRIFKIAFADAIVWVWFLQAAYKSRFSALAENIAYFHNPQPDISFWISLGVGIILVATRWDQIPKMFRIVCPLIAMGAVALVLITGSFNLQGTIIEPLIAPLFIMSYVGCQFLRIETLAKVGSLRDLAMCIVTSFLFYYVINAILLLMPHFMYLTFITLAPLAFLIYVNKPIGITDDAKMVTAKSFLLLPNILLIFLGIAGGLLVSAGSTNTALSLDTIFTDPSPVYLFMALIYMILGILVAFNYQFKKGMYFASLNIFWMIGTLIGSFLFNTFPDVPNLLFVIIAAIASLSIVVSFIVFQDAWIRDSRKNSNAVNYFVDELAIAKGLTKREIEVLNLLVEGRSIPYIQKTLYISEGTARTHAKHIYSKLDVHSKQELLDLFHNASVPVV